MFVCGRNHVEVLEVLVEKGRLDVNVANFQQQTPLHVAVHRDHVTCARRLIAYGADLNATVRLLLLLSMSIKYLHSTKSRRSNLRRWRVGDLW